MRGIRVSNPPDLLRDRQTDTAMHPHTPLCPYEESNPDCWLRRPVCFPLHHKDIAGTEGLEPSTFGLTGRSYFHTSYVPFVASIRFALMFSAYETE